MDAAAWNALFPVSTQVTAYPGTRQDPGVETWTRSTAWTLSGTPVVLVHGHAGGIALSHVDPVVEEGLCPRSNA
ncbi:hypothetical protein [Streptomyces yaizuensis]|uniref:Alpha/beta hydrolase n=1 Tax=Streptomyces yaizuensis TaxID=2989713 RepID=A0AA86MCN0_9ACTN|nr:hypothetical protein [Streptomyces sp. YSPA8]BDT39487.1 hypothetical protein SYYSPA8_36845 [Streptomyces sp. YSPA8]